MSNEHDKSNEPDMKDLSDLYQTTRNDEPSAALDAAILARAEEAVATKRKRPAWIAPVALAATVLLGVNLAVNLKDYSSDPDVLSESSVPVAQRAIELKSPPLPSFDEAAEARDKREDGLYRSLPNVAGTNTDGRSDTDVAPSVPRAVLRPPSDTTRFTDALDDAAAEPARKPVTSLRQIAARVQGDESTADTAENVVDDTTGRDTEQRQKLAIQESVAQRIRRNDPQDNIDAGVAETEGRPSGPQAMARLPSPTIPFEAAPPGEAVAAPPPAAATRLEALATRERERSTDRRVEAGLLPAPAPKLEQETEAESDDGLLKEIVVTGTSISDVDESPQRRLIANDQVARNARMASPMLSVSGDQADAGQANAGAYSTSAPVYVCDLDALRIDSDAIETAKVEARTVEPPRNAVNWPAHIRELADGGDYVAACTHLAAYQQLFPGVAMIELLPVTISTRD